MSFGRLFRFVKMGDRRFLFFLRLICLQAEDRGWCYLLFLHFWGFRFKLQTRKFLKHLNFKFKEISKNLKPCLCSSNPSWTFISHLNLVYLLDKIGSHFPVCCLVPAVRRSKTRYPIDSRSEPPLFWAKRLSFIGVRCILWWWRAFLSSSHANS